MSTGNIQGRTCLIRGREDSGRFGLVSKKSDVSTVVTIDSDRRATGQREEIVTDLVYDMRIHPLPVEEQGGLDLDLIEDLIIDSVHDAFHEEGIENPDPDEVAEATYQIMSSCFDEEENDEEGKDIT
jgi:hypothetical protein